MNHPEVATRPCEECAKWMYDDKTGKRSERRGGIPIARPAGTPTPCWNCPKKSPEEAKKIVLSKKNMSALDYYLTARAPGGHGLPVDRIVLRNHAIIDGLMRAADQAAMLRATVLGLGTAFAKAVR